MFDAATNTRRPSNMMGVRSKMQFPPNTKFGFLTGHVVSRSDYQKHENVKYKAYKDTLRALPVGLNRILLVDFDCLGSFINSASSAYKHTQYRSLPLVPKVRMVQSSKWAGFHYFQTMKDHSFKIGEEIHTLYVDGKDEDASADDDVLEATRVSLTQYSDDENEDPSISASQLSSK